MTPAELETARESVLLASLPEELQNLFLQGARVETFVPSEVIFRQGEPALALYILLEGQVKLSRITPHGSEAVLRILGRACCFGEASLIKGEGYILTATALSKARLARLCPENLCRLAHCHPEAAASLLATAMAHLHELVAQLEDLKARTGVQRLAAFLLSHSKGGGCPETIDLPYSKAMIASQLGMKPETLSRAFARLRHLGVRCDASSVSIQNGEQLQRVLASCGERSGSR